MSNLLTSDVYIEEESAAVRAVPSLATSVAGGCGVTQRGPVNQQVLANSYDEWERVFGGHIATSDSSLAVQMFFDNGGTELHWVRVVHHSVQGDPTTKTSAAATLSLNTAALAATAGSVTSSNTGPWDLEPGDTITISRDGGGNLTATFTATAAARECATAENYVLSNGQTLTVSINGGTVQTITFATANFVSIGAATAEEVAAVINSQLVGGKATVTSSGTKVTISSDRRGTGSTVNVTGGTANGALGFTVGSVAGTGNVSNIDAVTFAEAKTVIEAAVAGTLVTSVGGAANIASTTTGLSSSILVVASSTADDEFGFDNATHTGTASGSVATLRIDGSSDGTYANGIRIVIGAASSGEASRFNLAVELNGVVVETWTNLSMVPTDARFVETVINDSGTGSKYITATDLEAVVSSPNDNPVAGTFGPLTGGNDGLVGLADTDFIGGTSSNGVTGLRALDEVQNLSLVMAPGRATASVANGLISYCEIVREGLCFAIIDPPRNMSATQIVSYVKTTAAIQRLSEMAAIYWPNVLIDNPAKAVFGNTSTIVAPPSGAIAGLYARVDARKPSGVATPPAGDENGVLFKIRGLEMREVLRKEKRKLVFPELINPISIEPGSPIFVDGARTLKDTGNWPTIGERRFVIFVEQSMKIALRFMRHRNLNDRLFNEGKKTALAFMKIQVTNEALASTNPKEAFFLDFGKGLNTAATKFARLAYARLGLATSKPAEFVILKVTPDLRALEAELAAAA